jgi:hypothetical protein
MMTMKYENGRYAALTRSPTLETIIDLVNNVAI